MSLSIPVSLKVDPEGVRLNPLNPLGLAQSAHKTAHSESQARFRFEGVETQQTLDH